MEILKVVSAISVLKIILVIVYEKTEVFYLQFVNFKLTSVMFLFLVCPHKVCKELQLLSPSPCQITYPTLLSDFVNFTHDMISEIFYCVTEVKCKLSNLFLKENGSNKKKFSKNFIFCFKSHTNFNFFYLAWKMILSCSTEDTWIYRGWRPGVKIFIWIIYIVWKCNGIRHDI